MLCERTKRIGEGKRASQFFTNLLQICDWRVWSSCSLGYEGEGEEGEATNFESDAKLSLAFQCALHAKVPIVERGKRAVRWRF
jgi:hypothetical protein